MPAEETWTLRRLVEIPSPSGHEAQAAAFLAARMRDLGYLVRTDAAGNVIGEVGNPEGPRIMMVGHLDTVPGAIPVRESAGLLFGRGTVDAKGPLAAMVHAGARAASGDARVIVAGAVEEEATSRGAHHLAATVAPPDVLVIGEPSGAASVVVGYKGLLRLEYEADCPPAHTSSPAARACELAAGFWEAVKGLMPAPAAGPAFERAIPALVGIEGGITHARAEVSCRIPRDFEAEPFITKALEAAAGGRVTVIEHLPAVRTSRGAPLVKVFSEAVRRHAGPVSVKVKLGTSDMNILAPHWQVAAVAYGPGDAALDHTSEEHVSLSEYLLAIDVLADALPAIAQSLTQSRTNAGSPSEKRY
jgi:LysW-gamma-L-lysine carboxypeptidase